MKYSGITHHGNSAYRADADDHHIQVDLRYLTWGGNSALNMNGFNTRMSEVTNNCKLRVFLKADFKRSSYTKDVILFI